MTNNTKQIVLFKEGDQDAFEWIYKEYWSQVYNFTRLYITSIDDSKEIVQEVFIKLWDSKHLIDEGQNFKGFLFIITRNLIFNKKRDNLNKEYYKLSVLEAFSRSNLKDYYEVEEEIYATELGQYINMLIDTLPEKQKQIFLLSRKAHLSNKEIAEQMNLSIKSIEGYLTKTLRFLKENIILFYIFLLSNQ